MSYPPYQPGPAHQPQPTPAQPPAFGYAPPPAPSAKPGASKRQRLLILAAAGAAAAVIAVIAALNPGGGSTGGIDVTVTSCEAIGSRTAKIGFTVVNSGTTAESVRVEIEYRDGSGARIDTDRKTVRAVAPGDTVRVEESTILDAAPSGALTCAITDVS